MFGIEDIMREKLKSIAQNALLPHNFGSSKNEYSAIYFVMVLLNFVHRLSNY